MFTHNFIKLVVSEAITQVQEINIAFKKFQVDVEEKSQRTHFFIDIQDVNNSDVDFEVYITMSEVKLRYKSFIKRC